MKRPSKKRAPRTTYVSDSQLVISGFETGFSQDLDPNNRWVELANKIPWDGLVSLYERHYSRKSTGRPPLNPRVVIGALIIKHMCNLDDRETISQITENIYMQYFIGYSGFSTGPPFDPSLFVEIRKRLGEEVLKEMNLRILQASGTVRSAEEQEDKEEPPDEDLRKGELLMDATVSPQDIAYPTDLNLLNEARKHTEEIIDALNEQGVFEKKPRTYRRIARKEYLKVAQNRNPSRKTVRKGVGKQLRYLRRNISHIHTMLDAFEAFPLSRQQQKKFWVIQTLFTQQQEMFDERKHSAADRIVSIHQPHVRPIVRGKARARTEFGSKLHLSLVDGYAFVDTISWDAFNEGTHLVEYVENYKQRFGYYPRKVIADKLYWTRDNRKWLKNNNIKLAAKPLGRPSASAVANHVSPGERNPIEGKFGQAKNAYGMNRIRARLKHTSESWIASIILVLNLVKLARQVPCCLSFSAKKWIIMFSRMHLYRVRVWKQEKLMLQADLGPIIKINCLEFFSRP